MNINPEQLKNIASQLRCPNGEAGLEMADEMNKTNHGMTMNSIRHLQLAKNEKVLEIGPGNARHLAELMEMAPGLEYTGLDISVDMKEAAAKINATLVKQKQAQFLHYTGDFFPLKDVFFDKIVTVNTLYFWENPFITLLEIYRVLKPGGICNITYSHKDFMKNLPFVEYDFELYNDEDVLELIKESDFKAPQIFPEIESVKSKHGEMVNRPYSILSLRK